MSNWRRILLVVIAFCAPVLAQTWGVPGAGSGPSYDVSLGYTYLMMSIPGGTTANLNGVDSNGRIDFSRFWGATIDSSYVRTSNVLGMGQSGYVLTFMGGPVFHPYEHGNVRISLRALVGAGLVDSAVPVTSTSNLHGWVARPAYAAGGGIERAVSERFAIRVEGDYLRTAFVDAADVVQPQNNFRGTVSVVYHINQGR